MQCRSTRLEESVRDAILEAYEAPRRHYHTVEHLAEVLAALEHSRAEQEDPTALTLAAFFRDVVYEGRVGDDEKASATRARADLERLGTDQPLIARVEALVLATAGHQASEEDRDLALLLDADLSILGASPDRYARYANDIRKEYGWVEDAAYREGRRRVLESFLSRGQVFSHPHLMTEGAEERAQRNRTTEIESLGRPLDA